MRQRSSVKFRCESHTMTAEPRMNYWLMLTPEEQHATIRRLANSGVSDYGISAATGMAVEQVRTILGKHVACEGCE